MNPGQSPAWDGQSGTAGGAAFGAALRALAVERDVSPAELASAAGLDLAALETIWAGSRRVTVSELARFTHALRLHPIEFLQRGALLSLDVYAAGLDPLYFLPSGQIRHDARIYMREINPRHRVPERDMLVRNPTLKALMADDVLDALGQIEVLLTYLLRAAVQQTGGIL
jgi:transcriptional regulator with XRE-family HTH domain